MIESKKYGRLTMAFPAAFQVDFPYRWQQAVLNLSVTPSLIRGRKRYWQIDGRTASEKEIRAVLSNITNLLIFADFYDGCETAYLDDFMITAPEDPVGPDERICNGLPYMCNMPFNKVVFPGSHNAGAKGLMSCSTGFPAFSCGYNCQGEEITGQLNHGIRYFDIDIGGCNNTLHTVHNEDTRGRTISYIMDEFDAFLNSPTNRNEVIVITIANIIGNIAILQTSFYNEIQRFIATPERLHNKELTIFWKQPGNPWPTLGYLVDSNQRILIFVREAINLLMDNGVFSEGDNIHDTYKERDCTFSCHGVVDDTRNSCAIANPGKLVLVSVMCASGLCLDDLADLCDQWIKTSLWACMEERVATTGKAPVDVIPNFIVADWVVKFGAIVPAVREMNMWILQENGFPVIASSDLAEVITHSKVNTASEMYHNSSKQYYYE
ncbi:MAG: hypothetical protein JSV33_00785 [bacterium]|nr:MAG: hypothetical protein JSV33_00785 [bacterium]